ncbi:MAG: asparagine synthase (glutamine-hydrolyzing) [Bacteroidetes bacterium]|nr:asparagine synthase (glutamine-hydrolyzing) [Bacteroidota bacterium]
MCGITGIVYFDKDRVVEPSELKHMTDVIVHRGPDDEGFFIDNNIGLGFRRLSIIDLNTGHQPLSNHDGSLQIVFNGEIYNYQEERDSLLRKGYNFRTATDTEVILHLYAEYGEKCLEHLRGMFAFAIWDKNRNKLFCARDRFGIKPFHYYHDKEKFIFSSELKSINNYHGLDKTLSPEALDSYFAFGYITSNLSIYKNIHKLEAGNFLVINLEQKGSIEIKPYWDLSFNPDFSKTEKQWAEEIDSALNESVKLHMISDVPLGAFLSGGIDSSSVVALMTKNSVAPIKTFSIGFKEQEFDELVFAREIAQKYHCEHHEQILEPESISLLPMMVGAYDEPFSDSSAIPTYYVSKLARQFVTVALSGDGGDELFAGYNTYLSFKRLFEHPLNFDSPLMSKMLWGTAHKLLNQRAKGKYSSFFLSKDKNSLGAYSYLWSIEERKKLILPHLQDIRSDIASEEFKVGILKRGYSDDFITRMQALDLKTYMVDSVLTKVDRVSMLNSLEVRVPILDHKFAELTFRIPPHLKLNGFNQKYIFKKSMSKYLPDSILKHPKQGFGIPLSHWFKEDLNTYIKDILLSNDANYTQYLDSTEVRKLVRRNDIGKGDQSNRIWSLLFFEEWLKQNPRR